MKYQLHASVFTLNNDLFVPSQNAQIKIYIKTYLISLFSAQNWKLNESSKESEREREGRGKIQKKYITRKREFPLCFANTLAEWNS